MRTTVRTSVVIEGTFDKDAAFGKVCQLESYPSFMPDVKRVRVLERQGETGTSEWDIDIEGCPLNWKESDRFDLGRHTFSFATYEGDFEEFSGRWEVRTHALGVEIIFTVEYVLGIPVIEDIIGPVLKTKIERNSHVMLGGLRAELERRCGEDAETVQQAAL